MADIINIIESRSNLFDFIVDVSATSVAFVEMTSVSGRTYGQTDRQTDGQTDGRTELLYQYRAQSGLT